MMIRALRSEWLKHRRTFSWTLVVLGPLGLALLALVGAPTHDGPLSWSQLLTLVGRLWPILWIPFGAALLAALAAWHDARGDAWRALRVRTVPPAALYLAKLAVVVFQALVSSALLGALTLVVGQLVVERGQPVPWATLVLAVMLPAVAALPLLAIHLWVATAWGFAPAFALAVGGFISGAIGSQSALWLLIPWSWPIKVAESIGVVTGPQAQPSVDVVALGVALTAALALSAASAWWFARLETR